MNYTIKPALTDSILVNDVMYHQNEPDIKHGIFYWGVVERVDVARINREISSGSSLWWVMELRP